MRIGLASTYTMYQYHQRTSKSGLDDALGQIQSGLKIQSGYQDTTIFNKTLSLDYDITTLEQSKSVANNALTYTNNTDTALKDLVANMTNFKTKLIQGGNDIHSETSRLAIAKDLKAIRDHFLSIANTSIGGEFIFGGSATANPPFNPNGTYNGNNATLNALLGSNNALPYNITGEELFFGADNDIHRIISTNIPKFNQRELHPEIMDPNHTTGQGREVYITAEDTIRDLVGDDDSDPNNDPQEVFYITGRKADGTAFKAKFPMDTTSKVQDLLDRIGREFGNTESSKVVDVTLNKWGQIEIKDLTSGRSNIEFSMISSKWVDPANSINQGGDGIGFSNLNRAGVAGVKINTYVQSPFLNDFNHVRTIANPDDNDHRIYTFPTIFRTEDNKLATTRTLLRDVVPPETTRIRLDGNRGNSALDTPGTPVNPAVFLTITNTTTIQDLMDNIRTTYGQNGNVDVQFSDGRIIVIDNNVSKRNPPDRDDKNLPFTGNSSFRLFLTTMNGNQEINGFRYEPATEYDRVNFSRDGSKLTSNVSQIIRDSNKHATMHTKLSEVAGGSLNGHNYNFKVKDINGTAIEGRIEFRDAGSVMIITSPTQMNNHNIANIEIPILNPNGNPPQVNNTITPANEVTYQQLADTLGIVMNLSNSNQADLQNVFNANADYTNQTIKASYEKLIGDSKNAISIGLNINGKLEIKDLNHSATRMDFMLYDSVANNFLLDANGRVNTTNRPALTFQANNAIIADDPHTNFFEQIDTIIKSLEEGIYRPGGNSNYGDSMRNPGIQNAITTFDHLANHINKAHTKNGSQGSAFKYSIQRTEALVVQAKSVRSETINVDHAEALLQFSQLSLNYQAMLSTIGKISQLSLVNYI